MRCDIANMLKRAAKCVDPKRDYGAYAFMLEELEGHVRQVRDGTVSLDEFADFYMIRPEAPVIAGPCDCGVDHVG